MGAHVLLNLLKELKKVIKCEACNILSPFRNELKEFNNTGARMVDSIFHMTLKLFCNRVFGVKTLTFCQINATLLLELVRNLTKICKPLLVY